MPSGIYKRTKEIKNSLGKFRKKWCEEHPGFQDGEKHPFYGKHHTIKTKEKMKLARLGSKNHFYGKHHTIKTKEKLSLACKGKYVGKNNPAWKGGKLIQNKYFEIYSPTHPFKNKNNRVREHRLIVEKQLGRYLTKKETVHHIDNNPLNNKVNNLMIFSSNAAHKRFHGDSKNVKREEIIFDGRKINE